MKKLIAIVLFLGACDSDTLPPTEQEEPTEEPAPSVVVATPVPTEETPVEEAEEPTEEPTDEEPCSEPAPVLQGCFCSFYCSSEGFGKLISKWAPAKNEAEACAVIPSQVSCTVGECFCTCDPA